MSYVTGLVCAVPTSNKQAYIDHASQAAHILKNLGALHVMECWGADVPDGKVTSFPMAVKCKDDETVVFSWIIWPDKNTADTAMPKAMEALDEMNKTAPMPFDGKRLIYGDFTPIVEV